MRIQLSNQSLNSKGHVMTGNYKTTLLSAGSFKANGLESTQSPQEEKIHRMFNKLSYKEAKGFTTSKVLSKKFNLN